MSRRRSQNPQDGAPPEAEKSDGDIRRPPIAIVGIGCRFPGGVCDPASMWKVLRDGVDTITEIPQERGDLAAYFDARPATPGKMVTKWGGFLERLEMFDAAFFGISPREAERMDPQQRLLLEVAWEALEDAGQRIDRLNGAEGGVFIGMWLNDYEGRLFADPAATDFYMTTGTGRYSASGRLSYTLGLQGPSLTVDTACSSSLVAIHLACQSLWRNECSLALAGGANVILQPHISIAYSQSGMMAPDGRCKFGDAGCNGYVRSEGAGIVVLKTLPAALNDRDSIYALILGSAVNNDGRSSGYMATPAREGQERLLRSAYRSAGISPGQVRYVEAHGTGTRAGDPVEIGALGAVLSTDRLPGTTCHVGSVKTNFGHTEGAAGVAGLIKTALVLKHRAVPPSLHLKELNPTIPWKDYPLEIPRVMTPLAENSGPLIAGVSAFGIAGTNAHVVLTEGPGRDTAEAMPRPESVCLPISARSPEALAELARAYSTAIEKNAGDSVYDIACAAALRRTHHEYRAAVAARDRGEMIERLNLVARREIAPGVSIGQAEADGTRKVVFVCPGQGSQWVGMGRQLMNSDAAFRHSIEECEQAMRPMVDWSLSEQLELTPDCPRYRLNDIDVIQPTLVSIEIALAALWRSWGVEADAVVGHSLGEAAAAAVAGALSLQDAMRVICCRSALMRRVSGKGSMALVALPIEEAEAALRGYEDRVAIAVSNSPRSTVLSGDPDAIANILEKLQHRDTFCRLVKVDVASHSPQMDLLTDDLFRSLDGIQPRNTAVPIYSTVTAGRVDPSTLDPRYWTRNLRCPVLFWRTVQRLVEDEHSIFIELSPHPVLKQPIEETAGGFGRKVHAIASLEKGMDERASLSSSVGRLYTIGYPIDWARHFPRPGTVVSLPHYPWQRQRFWMETRPRPSNNCGPVNSAAAEAPLLGSRLPEIARLPRTAIWQNQFDDRFRSALRERGRDDPSELSELAYVEIAAAAASAVFGEGLHRISHLLISEGLDWRADANVPLQLSLTRSDASTGAFQMCSRRPGSEEWKSCVSGDIEAGQATAKWLYDLAWKEKARPGGAAARSGDAGWWVIFSDRGDLGAAVAETLRSRGDDCVLASIGDSFRELGPNRFSVEPGRREDMTRLLSLAFEGRRRSCRGILYLWSLDSPPPGEISTSSLDELPVRNCDAVLHLIQALVASDWKTTPRLWLVSRGAETVEASHRTMPELGGSLLWGLGRVMALEQPKFWGGLIDLPPSEGSDTKQVATTLCEEILASDGEDQVAIRHGRRYVARLVRSHLEAAARPLIISGEATYIITGGLGSVGLRLARWLTTKGARHLILTGRTGLPERSTWASVPRDTDVGKRIASIEALEEGGATVHIARVDVANEQEMTRLWMDAQRLHPPIRGIIHAAGILSARSLIELGNEELRETLRPKVKGAWLLHQLAESRERAGEPLDFFVLFSSGAAIWGSQGFAHYAAANHFLDALAYYRAALGLAATSVNWGWWEGPGLVSSDMAALFQTMGLKRLPSEQAFAALTYQLETGSVQRAIADIDWDVFRPIFEAKRKRPLLEMLAGGRRQDSTAEKTASEAKKSSLIEQIDQASPMGRRPLLHSYIRTQVAEILGFASADRIDPRQGFFKMGMDSIMTVQLRHRLEQALGDSLPTTIAFEYPTVETLTEFLADSVIPPDVARGSGAAAPSDEAKPATDASNEDLSEEELLDLLSKRLEKVR